MSLSCDTLKYNFLTDFNAQHNAVKYSEYNLCYEGQNMKNMKIIALVPYQNTQSMLESNTYCFLEQHYHILVKRTISKYPKHGGVKYILFPRATLSHISEACTISKYPKHAGVKYILLPRATLSHINEACTIKNVIGKEYYQLKCIS
jgi:hypothetical protein